MQSIAAKKKEENIIEYLLFMWQMEDLLRSVDFNLEELSTKVLSDLDTEDQIRNKSWFKGLADEMIKSSLQVSGHLSETFELLNELQVLEKTMVTIIRDESFIKSREVAKPIINEFKTKLDSIPRSDIEVGITALYGVLTLKLARKEVKQETSEAIGKISSFLRELSKAYRSMKAGTLPLNN